MTDAELKQQPRSVREEFERIKEGEIDHDEQLSYLKTQLADLLAKQHESQAVHDRIRVCLKWLPIGIASTENRLQEIKVQRVSAIAMALVDDKVGSGLPDFSLDDALVAEQKNAELYLERLRLSASGLGRQEKKARRAVELASNPCSAIESQINHRRDQLKLTEAKRRHGYAYPLLVRSHWYAPWYARNRMVSSSQFPRFPSETLVRSCRFARWFAAERWCANLECAVWCAPKTDNDLQNRVPLTTELDLLDRLECAHRSHSDPRSMNGSFRS